MIAGYLLLMLVLGMYFRRRSGQSTEDYFVSGRQVAWWLAGTSMVATTFAADTPLVVTGLVYTQGIAGNWLWWSFLPSGMMTVFLFARLWRRSGLLTDVQFAEMRYAGKPAAFLRGFRAVYLGLLMNCLILGWVTKAMTSIVGVDARQKRTQRAGDLHFLSDSVHRILCFARRLVGRAVDGPVSIRAENGHRDRGRVLWRAGRGRNARDARETGGDARRRRPGAPRHHGDVFPDFSRGLTGEALWTLPVLTFLVHLGVQWWAFWYPGAEPGGGGYIAQRIFSARDERHGLLSVLWFNIAHYALRPWPWILTALAAVALYPGLAASGIRLHAASPPTYMPHALRGILIAGFMAAFMSTIATQLNWGSSYLVEDFYRRFMRQEWRAKNIT